MDVELAPLLSFNSITFWVQLHNITNQCLTQATGEAMGNTIGSIVQVANLEDDGEGGKFLQIRLLIDITKPLPRCCKLWSEGEHVGWALLKFERFPNFCYWCGRVTHNERDCEVWLRGKGNLKKEEQQYGDWLRAKLVRNTKKKKKKNSGGCFWKFLWKTAVEEGTCDGEEIVNYQRFTQPRCSWLRFRKGGCGKQLSD